MAADQTYTLRISRMTIDKLGVKLYDRASAVVAELVANAYDADAESVTVSLPLATLLAPPAGGLGTQYMIEVVDDGHGMTPEEAQQYFLKVGRDRRTNEGDTSRKKARPVMGRKGIGKLAPFGICRRIEIISSGGKKIPKLGYLTSHFILDFEQIVKDETEAVELVAGREDRTHKPTSGTIIRLTHFLPKRVPNEEVFSRQLSARFGLGADDFTISIQDTRPDPQPSPTHLSGTDVPVHENTKLDLSAYPVQLEDGTDLPVTGWMAMAKKSYKYEELAGVRIFARGKIVAQTRDFEQPAGFTGEFTMRSYLVGIVHAEWLDQDEDLVRTDRQSILWESDLGRVFRKWGQDRIKEIATKTKGPRRESVRDRFLEVSKFEERAKQRYPDKAVLATALALARQVGSFAAADELDDVSYVNELAEVILSVAPHKALMESFHEFDKAVGSGEARIEAVADLFGKTRVAELAAYAQIARERVDAIERLEGLIGDDAAENDLQRLVEAAPWLIDTAWVAVSQNQSLKTFASAFRMVWKKLHNQDLSLTVLHSNKRPDFVLLNIGHRLHVVELKAAGHTFDDTDFMRLFNYVEAFEAFFEEHHEIAQNFVEGWRIDLIADKVQLKEPRNKALFEQLTKDRRVVKATWHSFLAKTKRAHQSFLEAREKAIGVV